MELDRRFALSGEVGGDARVVARMLLVDVRNSEKNGVDDRRRGGGDYGRRRSRRLERKKCSSKNLEI